MRWSIYTNLYRATTFFILFVWERTFFLLLLLLHGRVPPPSLINVVFTVHLIFSRKSINHIPCIENTRSKQYNNFVILSSCLHLFLTNLLVFISPLAYNNSGSHFFPFFSCGIYSIESSIYYSKTERFCVDVDVSMSLYVSKKIWQNHSVNKEIFYNKIFF